MTLDPNPYVRPGAHAYLRQCERERRAARRDTLLAVAIGSLAALALSLAFAAK